MIALLAIPVVVLIVVLALRQRKKYRERPAFDIGVALYDLGNSVLGWTSADGRNIRVNPILLGDDDMDRPIRVVIHEFLHSLHIARGEGSAPHSSPDDWYSRDGDSKPTMAPFPPEEMAWLAAHQQTHTVTASADDPLDAWVSAAIYRINTAAGRDVLRR